MNANTRSTFSGVWSNGVNVVPNRPFSSSISDPRSVVTRAKSPTTIPSRCGRSLL